MKNIAGPKTSLLLNNSKSSYPLTTWHCFFRSFTGCWKQLAITCNSYSTFGH